MPKSDFKVLSKSFLTTPLRSMARSSGMFNLQPTITSSSSHSGGLERRFCTPSGGCTVTQEPHVAEPSGNGALWSFATSLWMRGTQPIVQPYKPQDLEA